MSFMFQNKKLHVKIIETKIMSRTIYPKFLLYALFIILKFSQKLFMEEEKFKFSLKKIIQILDYNPNQP